MVDDLRDCEGFERYSHAVYGDCRAKGKAKGWPPPEVRAPVRQRRSECRPCHLANRPSCDAVRLGRAPVAILHTSPRARPARWGCLHLFDWPELAPLSPPAPQAPLSRRCAGAVLLPALALRLSGSCIARRDREACGRDGGGVTSPAVSLHLQGHAPTRGCAATTPALPPCVNRLRRET